MADEVEATFLDVSAAEFDPVTMAPVEQNPDGKTRARIEDGTAIDPSTEVVLVPPERGLPQ